MIMLWQPSDEVRRHSNLRRYMDWLASCKLLAFDDYDALWRWSVQDVAAFWASQWEYFALRARQPPECVLARREMPGARVTGSRLPRAGA